VSSENPMMGYRINRKTVYLGRLLHHAWQPDWKSRLVRREAGAKWGGYDPHDVLQMEHPWGRLEGDLLHYSYTDVEDHFRRTVGYARTTAKSYHKMGKRFRWHKLFLSPLFSFIKGRDAGVYRRDQRAYLRLFEISFPLGVRTRCGFLNCASPRIWGGWSSTWSGRSGSLRKGTR